MSVKCAAIIELHCMGKTNSEIVKLLKAPRSTVIILLEGFKYSEVLKIVLEVEDHKLLGHQMSLMLSEPKSSAIQRDP